jgi:hypothetical protein
LTTGNANKIVKGTEIDDEFDAIQVAIATKANLNSPTLTGTPLAPTAAVDTNTTQIATTAFVEAAKAAVEAAYTAADAANEAARDLVNMIAGDGITGGGTIDASRTLTLGTPSTINATSTNAVTATSHTHALDVSGEFTGAGIQDVTGDEGYQVLPGGVIVQWGTTPSIASTASYTETFSKTFPTACICAVANKITSANNDQGGASAHSWTTTQVTITNPASYNGVGTAATCSWIAIGY